MNQITESVLEVSWFKDKILYIWLSSDFTIDVVPGKSLMYVIPSSTLTKIHITSN